jgi:hypothetical protein
MDAPFASERGTPTFADRYAPGGVDPAKDVFDRQRPIGRDNERIGTA